MSINEPEALDLQSETGVTRPLVLKFGGSLVEQLGAQLYPSVTATVAELISNAWDADALNVWVTVPFDQEWGVGAELVVLDDGHGMSRSEAQQAYLVVGRRKRMSALGDRSEGGRLVHGRKGIGKLAAFGTAGYLECTTLRGGETTSFGIDYDEVRRMNPDQDYYVDRVAGPSALVAPDGTVLEHGTRVRLTKLRVKRKISAESFQISMSRRFALRGMNVLINGQPLQRFEIPLRFRLPRDQAPDGVTVDDRGWGVETLDSGDVVKWWIGFTEKPLTEGDQQGISVLARDKMAQRPFKFERSAGTTDQLGFEYLVGEVEADWLDQGDEIDTDYIQSNRDQLQLENVRLDEFMAWGRKRLTWALRVRGDLSRREQAAANENNADLEKILHGATSREKRALRGVADKLARLPEIDQGAVNDIMRSVVNSRSDAQVHELMEEIAERPANADEELKSLVRQFGAIDARRVVEVIEARLATISKLETALAGGTSAAEISAFAQTDIWLIDPRWHLLGDAVEVDKSPDLFVLAPTKPSPVDELVVVKAVSKDTGSKPFSESATIERFRKQVAGVREHYGKSESPPFIRGLLIAADFSPASTAVGRDLEGTRLHFKSWAKTLDDSTRMHRGWLAVSKRRAGIGDSDES